MLSILDKTVRRFFAWPILILGMILTQSGGMCIKTACWIMDIDYTELEQDAN